VNMRSNMALVKANVFAIFYCTMIYDPECLLLDSVPRPGSLNFLGPPLDVTEYKVLDESLVRKPC
jgi:hypothetical protein